MGTPTATTSEVFAGAQGKLPGGLTFRVYQDMAVDPRDIVGRPMEMGENDEGVRSQGRGGVSAHLPDGTMIGGISWHHDVVRNVIVHPDYQRRGVGTALWERARQERPHLRHSDALTDQGRSWQQALGATVTTNEFLYHHTAPAYRESIERHGLLSTYDQTGFGAVFLTDKPSPGPHTDVWRVNVSGLPVEDDPTGDLRVDEHWSAIYGDVGPERLQRVAATDPWSGFPFSQRHQDAPREGETPPERSAAGHLIFFHGTSPEGAAAITRERRIKPDGLGVVGVATTPGAARIFGLMKSGRDAVVLKVHIDPASLNEHEVTHEIGGSGKDQFLIHTEKRMQDWDGVPLSHVEVHRTAHLDSEYLWHIAMPWHEDAIRAHGLTPGEDGRTYLTTDPATVPYDGHIWKVDMRGLDHHDDPENDVNGWGDRPWRYFDGSISPERLTLVGHTNELKNPMTEDNRKKYYGSLKHDGVPLAHIEDRHAKVDEKVRMYRGEMHPRTVSAEHWDRISNDPESYVRGRLNDEMSRHWTKSWGVAHRFALGTQPLGPNAPDRRPGQYTVGVVYEAHVDPEHVHDHIPADYVAFGHEHVVPVKPGAPIHVVHAEVVGESDDDYDSWEVPLDHHAMVGKRAMKQAQTAEDRMSKGIMVALMLPEDVAKKIALPGGDPPENMHITLAYIGMIGEDDYIPERMVEDDSFRDWPDLSEAVSAVAEDFGPLVGRIKGTGTFPKGDEGVPFFAKPDIPSIDKLRESLVAALGMKDVQYHDEHSFKPHITLKYLKDGEDEPDVDIDEHVEFDRITIEIGDLSEEHPLLGMSRQGNVVRDFEGQVGDRSHVTRHEDGHLPIDVVRNMPGVKGEVPGEHRNRQGEAWESFKEDVRQNGIQRPIFITVDHGDVPRISEGNHRRDAAVELGLPEVPVEIRYFGHAEQQGSVLERGQRKTSSETEKSWHAAAWFEPGFPVEKEVRDAAQEVSGQIPNEGPVDCTGETECWVDALRHRGVDVAEHHGWYMDTPHAWLEVGGKIMDPTAHQFRRRIDPSGYRSHTVLRSPGERKEYWRRVYADPNDPKKIRPYNLNPQDFEKHAAYTDVREKARTIREDGGVQFVRHDDDVLSAVVVGDHGVYDCTVYRQFPGSQRITLWECTCEWAKYVWARAPEYKHLEGRMCSHCLAMLYEAWSREYLKGWGVQFNKADQRGELVERESRFMIHGADTRKYRLQVASDADETFGPDTSKVVHTFEDGWTIRQLQTGLDRHREGCLMHNCWREKNHHGQELWPDWYKAFRKEKEQYGIDVNVNRFDEAKEKLNYSLGAMNAGESRLYSLRDADNLPKASFFHDSPTSAMGHPRGAQTSWVFGQHDVDPKPEHLERIREWHAALPYDVKEGPGFKGKRELPDRIPGRLLDPVPAFGSRLAMRTRLIRDDPYRLHRALMAEADFRRFGAERLGRHPENDDIRASARDYMAKAGMPYEAGDDDYVDLDEDRAKRIADTFEDTPHDPQHPEVRSAYEAFKHETAAQYDHLVERGYHFEPWGHEGQPYADSRGFTDDLRKKHLYYFKTLNPDEESFGKGQFSGRATPEQVADNPLLEDAGRSVKDSKGVEYHQTFNDLFRAVHDVYGHGKEGNQTGPRGEENAWRQHLRMYSPEARRAMTTETRGQNSWVNFGRHLRQPDGSVPKRGEPGYRPLPDRPFADQKVMLLPHEFSELPEHQRSLVSIGGMRRVVPAPPSMEEAWEYRKRGVPEGPYFHGTNAVLKPGDVLTSSASRGQPTIWGNYRHYDPDLVYLSNKNFLAGSFAYHATRKKGGEPHVYEAEPMDEVIHDPEFEQTGFGSDQVVTSRAKVIREVPKEEWFIQRRHGMAEDHRVGHAGGLDKDAECPFCTQERFDQGKTGGSSKIAASDSVPSWEPGGEGAPPVPEGHVRLFHYTDPRHLDSIRQHGLTISHARGHEYGEPSVIWAAAGGPPQRDNWADSGHAIVEFHVHPDDLDIGRWRTPEDLEGRHAHVTLNRDVKPSEFVAIHEPWHAHVRYLRDYKDKVDAGEYDWLMDDPSMPEYQKALQYMKKRGATEIADEDSPLDYHGYKPKRMALYGDEPSPDFKGGYFEPGTKMVAFLDYTPVKDWEDKQGAYIHYTTVRQDQRGQGHAQRLTAEVFKRFPGEINFGDVMHEAAGHIFEKYRDDPKTRDRVRGKWYGAQSPSEQEREPNACPACGVTLPEPRPDLCPHCWNWIPGKVAAMPKTAVVRPRDLHIPISDTMHGVLRGLHSRGHQPLIVGGAVRDAILGRPSKDVDVEVHGMSYEDLANHLAPHGRVDVVGQHFGVVKFRDPEGNDYDFSIPRRESTTGVGHRDFHTEFDPDITPREAAARRDFTMNALAYDPVGHQLHDYFGGEQDLHDRVLRHTSEHFSEDPLRVLRGMQFAARFGMRLHPDSAREAASISHQYDTIPKERVGEEFMKLTKGSHPGAAIPYLQQSGWSKNFPELHAMYGAEQDPEWHPEGDVASHTQHTMDHAATIADREGLHGDDRATLVLASMLHDVGKPTNTQRVVKDGVERITSHGHDTAGGPIAERFLHSIGIKPDITHRVVPLVANHMAHLNFDEHTNPRVVRRLAQRVAPSSIRELSHVMEADNSGRPPLPKGMPPGADRMVQMADESHVQEGRMEPLIKGRHVMPYFDNVPGRHIGEIVNQAYEAQMNGDISNEDEAQEWLRRRMRQSSATSPLLHEINERRPHMAAAAQKVIDAWDQSPSGRDEEYGYGGACDAVDNAMTGEIAGLGCIHEGGQEGEDHAWSIIHRGDEAYGIDLPAHHYEVGGGYHWTKLDDPKIEPHHIDVFPLHEHIPDLREDEWCEDNEESPLYGPGGLHHAKKKKKKKDKKRSPQKCMWCNKPAYRSYGWAEGMAYIPTCREHDQKTQDTIVNTNNDEISGTYDIDGGGAADGVTAAVSDHASEDEMEHADLDNVRWMGGGVNPSFIADTQAGHRVVVKVMQQHEVERERAAHVFNQHLGNMVRMPAVVKRENEGGRPSERPLHGDFDEAGNRVRSESSPSSWWPPEPRSDNDSGWPSTRTHSEGDPLDELAKIKGWSDDDWEPQKEPHWRDYPDAPLVSVQQFHEGETPAAFNARHGMYNEWVEPKHGPMDAPMPPSHIPGGHKKDRWAPFEENNIPHAQIKDMVFFDAVAGNHDRHHGNMLVAPGHLTAIDHSLAFHTLPVRVSDEGERHVAHLIHGAGECHHCNGTGCWKCGDTGRDHLLLESYHTDALRHVLDNWDDVEHDLHHAGLTSNETLALRGRVQVMHRHGTMALDRSPEYAKAMDYAF